MGLKDFLYFWKTKELNKDTVEEVIQDYDREIHYLIGWRENRKVLERIDNLRTKRNDLKNKYKKYSQKKVVDVIADESIHATANDSKMKAILEKKYEVFSVERKRDGMWYVLENVMGRKNIVNAFRTEPEANNLADELNRSAEELGKATASDAHQEGYEWGMKAQSVEQIENKIRTVEAGAVGSTFSAFNIHFALGLKDALKEKKAAGK